MLADPAWQPLHDHLRGFEWDAFVSVPLVARDRPLGAMNAYYLPGQEPDDEDVRFLTSMADQAAVAADNARLFAELKGKAELEERHRLARELHDSACQELFSMNLHIRAAQLALARDRASDDDRLSRHFATIEELAQAALEDMRALVVELYPTLLHSEGLLVAVRQHAASVSAREGLKVTVHAAHDRLELNAGSELEAYRLIQEALHNAVKHSNADAVDIGIGPDPSDAHTLVLEVADDGSGFDSSAVVAGRLGLASMRERAERLGGELTITSPVGSGTTVRAVVPRVLGGSSANTDEPPAGRLPVPEQYGSAHG
jgi:signal transduction histidine kinase